MQSKLPNYYRWALPLAIVISGTQVLTGLSGLGANSCAYSKELGSIEPDNHISTPTPSGAKRFNPGSQSLQRHDGEVERSPFAPADYQLIWNEEFNGTELDMKKWVYRGEGRSSDGSGASVLSRSCISLDGLGQLRLETKQMDGVLQTGMISTNGSFEPLYGYFEARIRFQRHQGHHGAFWLKPQSFGRFPGDPGQSGVEIDIAEFFGSGREDYGMGVNIYWKAEDGGLERRTVQPDLSPILASNSQPGATQEELCDQFHVYSLIWTPTHYEFFVDGHKIFATEEGISHQRQPIILSLLSHKWEANKLDRDKLDDPMLVDYVRVYQVSPAQLSDRAAESTRAAR